MRRRPLLTFITLLAAVVGLILAVALSSGGGHPARTPQRLNGHQSVQQKVAKERATLRDLTVISQVRSKKLRAQVCDQIPEGYAHMGICAKAPAYARSGIGKVRLAAAISILSGSLGVDTSHWDHCGAALYGPRFWIVAVGDGGYIDPCAGPLYHALRIAGIVRSTYYFTRQYLDPTWSADHYAGLIRQMGATDSLKPVNDAEAITSCYWIYVFDARLARDLGLDSVIDYSSPGLWPGCHGKLAYTAAYGPIGQRLSGGFAVYLIQQFTDGQVGPGPHCLAVCGDVDIATANLGLAAVHVTPPSPPIAYTYWQACSALDAITWFKEKRGHGHTGPIQHRHAVAIKLRLRRANLGCARPGWQYRPPRPFRAYPIHGNGQKGNLA